ncbi:MAG: tungsten ABC transporter substrate-binding protein, partial [Burkholderiaceae bacterium]
MTPPLLVKRILVAVSLASSLLATSAHATDNTLVMASTTSTEQSGLFAHLLPAFTTATGIS